MTRFQRALGRWEVFLLLVLVAVFICGSQVSQYFLTSSNISIALAGMMPVAIVAVPMTLIIITGEIDISVGSMVGLCAASMAVCLEQGFPVATAMLAGVLVGTLAGLFNGAFVVYAKLPSLVVTIGTLALYRGIAQIVLKERGVSAFPDWYQNLGFGTIYGTPIPWSLVIFVSLVVGFAIFLHRTHWGRALYAIGNNREAALFSGINVNRAILGVFIASGTMCSLAAVILTAYLASARSDAAIGLELLVITAVVLGGVNIFGGSGTMVGVLVSLLVLAFVQNALGLAGVTPEEQQIVTGGVLVMTLIVFSTSGIIRKVGVALWRSRATGSLRH
ncbi:MAG TPA: ABC transporter permease [Vicinamibacterales bacterium]|jgi:rhamnose transport system permease protein|nr:ABC transporter permease [Vicinamibacterales bacterium]HEX2477761.1 ABC transporter permease [Geminicoccaceae bacterium]